MIFNIILFIDPKRMRTVTNDNNMSTGTNNNNMNTGTNDNNMSTGTNDNNMLTGTNGPHLWDGPASVLNFHWLGKFFLETHDLIFARQVFLRYSSFDFYQGSDGGRGGCWCQVASAYFYSKLKLLPKKNLHLK